MASMYTEGADLAAIEAYQGNSSFNPDLVSIIGTWIAALFGLLGIVFLVLIIYAGVLWMTAGGNADNVKKARDILVNAVVGILITASSYAIAYFVLGSVS